MLSFPTNTIVFASPSKIAEFEGSFISLSIMILIGLDPPQFRVVSDGLSCKTVLVPTKIAISDARILCAICREYGLVIQTGLTSVRVPSCGEIKWSKVSAHFRKMYGRFFWWKVKNLLFISIHSASSTPVIISDRKSVV